MVLMNGYCSLYSGSVYDVNEWLFYGVNEWLL